MDEMDDVAERASRQSTLPSHVILLAEWGAHPVVGQLDVEGVKYRPATEFERRIGGFVD